MSERVWFLAPILGLLRQLGGTFNKLFWKIGFPVSVVVSTIRYLGWSWWWLLLAGLTFAVTTLPVTLLGDSVSSSWINWIWVWILGYLMGLPSVVIGIVGGQIPLALLASLVPAVITGLYATLSNIPATSEYFPWKYCEGVMGFFTAVPYAMTIEKAAKEKSNVK